MANEPAEIYANVRNKALEEAAVLADSLWIGSGDYADDVADRIRALKTPEISHAE